MDLVVDVDDPRAADVREVLTAHLAFASHWSPPDHVHALDPERLVSPDVTFFGARRGGVLLGVGALRQLDPDHAELKSMHVRAAARGQGVGRALLDHLLATARERGCRRVSLETGTMDAFAPARTLYTAAGFATCPPFAAYTDNPYSTCMTLELTAMRRGTSA